MTPSSSTGTRPRQPRCRTRPLDPAAKAGAFTFAPWRPADATILPRFARLWRAWPAGALALTVAGLAHADGQPEPPEPSKAEETPSVSPPPPPQVVEVTPPPREAKPGEIIPTPKPEEPPPTRLRFVADPISDGAVLSLSAGVGALSAAILSTGEIVPQQPQSPDRLLGIDRSSVSRSPDSTWQAVSNVTVLAAFGYAGVDTIWSGFRDSPDAAMADAFIYGESIAVSWAVSNLAKIAFRRPRPSAYREQQRLYEQYGQDNAPDISETDSALSFYSGHASFAATLTATATYLAFARAPRSPRPWITLGVGTALTALTCVGRVQGGQHFPTDVIAGTMAGAGIGILVPHLHRSDDTKQRPVWIGAAPSPGGGAVSFGGAF
jgi:membrane-associated phospholipid phosphatase